MRRIAILNQKGGVGKTTTAVNLAAALAECGQRVCVIDLDPQAHATTHLGIEPDGKAPSMYDVLTDSRPLAEVRRKVEERLWVAPSDINLAAAEVELAGVVGREVILRDLQEYLDRGRAGNAPWAKARIFGTRVRRNIKLAECPSFGQSIFQYAPGCHGAADYAALAQEVLGEAPAVLEQTLLMVDCVLSLTVAGGWFGGHLFPPIGAKRRKTGPAY